jgi:predicted nucleotidyltransferase component of viral defense system
VISYADLKSLALEWGIADHVVEKNYVIGWVLWGIGQDQDLKDKWVFKGGTCLKKCYLETYRFSEDLDFTVLPEGPINPEDVQPILKRVIDRVHEESGINFSMREPLVEKKEYPYYAKGKIYYQGPRNAPSPASIILDLISSEKLVQSPVINKIAHSYPDDLPETAAVLCYSLEEIFAEKIRAMGERGMPRDLYDIIFLFREKYSPEKSEAVKSILISKCETKGVAVPTYESIKGSPSVEELKSEWANMLGHQLPALPPFEDYWKALTNLFDWLEGKYQKEILPEVQVEKGVSVFKPSAGMWPVIKKAPLEAIRYAAINHLCVNLTYNGTKRILEPYSLRQSKEGNLILYSFKVSENQMKAYRIDRIQGVEITQSVFKPRFRIEFPAVGTIYAPSIEREKTFSFNGTRSSLSRPRHSGLVYIYQCPFCGKTFRRSKYDPKLREHKDKSGYRCPGRSGIYQGTSYQ